MFRAALHGVCMYIVTTTLNYFQELFAFRLVLFSKFGVVGYEDDSHVNSPPERVVGATPPPRGFSPIAKKTAARSTAGFLKYLMRQTLRNF